MSPHFRVSINWTGFIGAPGFTNLHFRTVGDVAFSQAHADDAVAKVGSWLASWRTKMPGAVTTVVDPLVTEFNSTTGDMIGFLATTPPASGAGTDNTGFSAPSGACINWVTSGVRNGRRVRGRTFMVPLGKASYDTTGTLTNADITAMNTATTTLLNADTLSELCVWARPSGPEATDGEMWPVINFNIPDKAALLTSRRD